MNKLERDNTIIDRQLTRGVLLSIRLICVSAFSQSGNITDDITSGICFAIFLTKGFKEKPYATPTHAPLRAHLWSINGQPLIYRLWL
jgi:hypothetical protein